MVTCEHIKRSLLSFIRSKQVVFTAEQGKLIEKSRREGGLDEEDTVRDAELTAMRAVCDDIEQEVKHIRCK